MMMTIKVNLACLFLILLIPTRSEAQGWRGIIPLHSTRADVERLIGPSKSPEKYMEFYKLVGEYVFIEYSSGPCSKDRDGGWDVPLNTVVSLYVRQVIKPRLDDLNIDLSKYEKTEDYKFPGVFYYYYAEDGLRLTVMEGKVDAVEYGPKAKEKHLLCPRFKDR
jgi:hypothetical protein